ncbi:MAG: glycosyltransferase [Deltaproteobacteria bacterium]|nr:glycosyltransferase [Candidatus Anaeroferrophillus wilburensis]MBN2889924.1 glycosyltransferase [Deltaproteobacteria bacterium]
MAPAGTHNSKHIAIFVHSFGGSGGAERVMLNLASGLKDQGHKVDLVMARQEGLFLDQVPPEIRIVDLKVRSARQSIVSLPLLGKNCWFWARMVLAVKPHFVLGALPSLARYLQKEHPDALISSTDYPNVVAILARRLAKVKTRIIATVHIALSMKITTVKKRRVKDLPRVCRRFYPQADAIVAVSQGVADDLAQVLDFPVDNITTIYNPVVSPALESLAAEPLEHPWFIGEGPPVVITVGGFKVAKDHATLLKAVAIVRSQRPLRLVMLGEGKLQETIAQLAEELHIAEDVDMLGFVDNPYKYMARASLFVLSSIYEGLPTVMVEALACGCPVVSTDCPSGPAEILDHGRYGRLVPVQDEHALALAILSALDEQHDPSVLKARGMEFSLAKATEDYLRLIP